MSNFKPSINIIRDEHQDFNYIITKNVSQILEQLINNHSAGFKVFNIVGSYGTGKSSFLLAIIQTLSGINEHLRLDKLSSDKNFKVISIAGSYKSFREEICNHFGIKHETERLLDEITLALNSYSNQGEKILITVDEFGKFLEYAAKNNPEQELFFLQEFAELISGKNFDVLMLTTLHQNFDAYSSGLSLAQKQEWFKVKGRFKELQFNEPIENLIYLLLENTKLVERTSNTFLSDNDIRTIREANICDFSNKLEIDDTKSIYPFDPVSIVILAKALQRYGQNERSIFSFVESYDYLGLKAHDTSQGAHYSISSVYDYLFHNYHSYIYSKDNPYYLQWAAINKSIERSSNILGENREQALKIVKLIGLLNIFADAGAKVDASFLSSYMSIFENVAQDVTASILNALESKKIIRYLAFRSTYILFEGTDLDIDLALHEASQQIPYGVNIVDKVKKYFPFNVEIAKASFLRKGSPRFFAYVVTDTPLHVPIADEIDGRINLLVNEDIDRKELIKFSEDKDDVIYCLLENLTEIKLSLYEIDKAKHVIANIIDDKVATTELNNMKAFFVSKLIATINSSIFDCESVCWVYKGEQITIDNKADLNRNISKISDSIYYKSPILKNELINRAKVSSTISTAWNKLFSQFLTHSQKEELGFDKDKFPAEKTIYLALLKNTGIHRLENGMYGLHSPLDASFVPLWERCEEFLIESKNKERKISDLIEALKKKPYRIKHGVIEFWIPLFLLAKQSEYALYEEGTFVPELSLEVLQLIRKSPHKFAVKAFNVTGVRLNLFNKYREMINGKVGTEVTNDTFIDTIKPFLIFYSGLSEYAKNTNKLTKSTIKFRKAIVFAKDPEQTFFEAFPNALGYSIEQLIEDEDMLERYVSYLQKSISELRSCYQELVERIEHCLLDELGYRGQVFDNYKKMTQNRFENVNKELLTTNQKVFYTRLYSNIDDRIAWVSSLVQPVLGKKLESIQDDEETLLIQDFKHTLRELDNLREFSDSNIDIENEHIVKCTLQSLQDGLVEKTISIPRAKLVLVDELKKAVKDIAKGDDKVRLIALANLLMDELNEYKS